MESMTYQTDAKPEEGRGAAMSREIPLSKGLFAIVDAADFEWLSRFKWCAHEVSGRHYAVGRDGKRMRRMGAMIAKPGPGEVVDFRSGDTLDHRRSNLRVCSRADAQRNRQGWPEAASHHKGVFAGHKDRWVAKIRFEGVLHHLGSFASADDAAIAYDVAAKKFFGEFARLNFPPTP